MYVRMCVTHTHVHVHTHIILNKLHLLGITETFPRVEKVGPDDSGMNSYYSRNARLTFEESV